ncbi:AAA family ATPase, partial [Liquorilactobacillus satsumensis]|uniref:AAA family ATPase n=1 Tax=Liquorilactobacillus satsumensis TaxID=259059 RepID=UPI0039ECD333
MANIIFFYGSNKDFRSMIQQYNTENCTPFMELIREYNVKVRAGDVMGNDDAEFEVDEIENVVIFADDFASVTDHVISNFSNIVLLGHDIQNLYIQNPPKRVELSIRSKFSSNEISEQHSPYFCPNTNEIKNLYESLQNGVVIGQNKAKKETCVGLFKAAYTLQKRPTVLMFYGPSGVGKTELAKMISRFYKGKLTRIQFSMMQTEEAYKYIFGDTHARPSMAKDLLARQSNVILIDEFDKASPGLYNVFYQMFDEGVFEDMNYKVDLSSCIFILTSNFNDENSIVSTVGMPVYSRIDKKIKFEKLSREELKL